MSNAEETSEVHTETDTGEEGLFRGLGPLEATTIIVGGTIGSGIFRAPNEIAQAVGSPGMSLLVWVVCGIIAISGGLCIAELGAMIPRTGGIYVYIREAYNRKWLSFIYGWAAFWLVWPISIAAVANVFATYLDEVIQYTVGVNLGVWEERLISVACVLLLTVINYMGVRLGGQVTNWFTYLKVAALGGLIVLGIVLANKGSMSHFTPFWGTATTGGFNFTAFGAAMITGLFAYEGWTFSSYVAGETKNPRRNIPLSIVAGMVFVMGIYLLANFIYLFVLPFDQFQQSDAVASEVMRVLIGDVGGLLISIGVMCSTFGGVNVQIMIAPRIYFALAKDGMFFKSLSKVHPDYRTPANAILWQGILTCLFALSGQYDEIISYGAFTTNSFGILTILAVVVLRKKRPNADRPYRVWGYPFTPFIFVAVIGGYLATLLLNEKFLFNTLIGLTIVAIGIPFYFYWNKKNS